MVILTSRGAFFMNMKLREGGVSSSSKQPRSVQQCYCLSRLGAQGEGGVLVYGEGGRLTPA